MELLKVKSSTIWVARVKWLVALPCMAFCWQTYVSFLEW